MSNPTLCPVIKQRFFDANGVPLAGGKLYSYASGTTTPKATYADVDGTPNTNPVVLDSEGCADVWLNGSYKLVLKDSADVQIWETDGIDSTNGVAAVQTFFTNALLFLSGPVSDRPTPDATLGQANHGMLYFAVDEHKAYRWNGTTWVDVTTGLFPVPPARYLALQFIIDGGGVVPGTGAKYAAAIRIPKDIPADWTVTGWSVLADASGSAVVDIKRSTYAGFPGPLASIAGTGKPTVSTAQKAEADATGWSAVTLQAGDVLVPNLDSVSTCKSLVVTLFVTAPAV